MAETQIVWVGEGSGKGIKPKVRLTCYNAGKKKSFGIAMNERARDFLGGPPRIRVGFNIKTKQTLLAAAQENESNTLRLGRSGPNWRASSVKALEKMEEYNIFPYMDVWCEVEAQQSKGPGQRDMLVIPCVEEAERQQGIIWPGKE